MTQTQQVIETMQRLGGVATFGKLNSEMDFSSWGTKTPEASVRRIVQDSPAIFRLKPGLWAMRNGWMNRSLVYIGTFQADDCDDVFFLFRDTEYDKNFYLAI